ncbi:Aste57867_20400 [Aphanomyces stellatus]|uniref:Aste57867_20400 protein n=1 Tax=Aphanomyces stellatus TaxID=120398 RepID=A0A485LF12_9STRA|nr:hypothetical protein As57867_020334 [Aphanomyces stellatus]VFT97086.1 Aste57867_20400 [Aphanomyces stellatus]
MEANSSSSVRDIVADFLATGGADTPPCGSSNQEAHEVDDAIVEYITQLMETADVDDQQVAECIASFCPQIEECSALSMVQLARACAQEEDKDDGPTPQPTDNARPSKSSMEEMVHLQDLMELAPHLSLECIDSIYHDMFLGDVARAAAYIVTHYCEGDMYTPVQVDPTIRRVITSKYGEQVVEAPPSPSNQAKKPTKVKCRPTPKEGLVRYYDGKVVTTKGVKFVEEKKEEYDGGSRGRVKTKGKRGKGWA